MNKAQAARPLCIYLDSSDYSDLTDPRKECQELKDVKAELLRIKESRRAEFWFSAVSIIETAPVDIESVPYSEARAALLAQLCGRNALISPDKLAKGELTNFAQNFAGPAAVHSKHGDWFPDFGNVLDPTAHGNSALQAINSTQQSKELNRAKRRTLGRLEKNGRLTASGKRVFQAVGHTMDYSKMLDMYPMKPEYLRDISAYFLGYGSKSIAERALRESLRDPRWVASWYAKHHEEITPIIKWLREPSRKLQQSIGQSATEFARLIEKNDDFSKLMTNEYWQRLQPSLLGDWLASCLEKLNLHRPSNSNCTETDRALCPGLATSFCAMLNVMRNSFGTTGRKPKASDFGDCAHAIYAPYVDIFRCDTYISQHIFPLVGRYGTTVVHRLIDLPNEIHRKFALSAR